MHIGKDILQAFFCLFSLLCLHPSSSAQETSPSLPQIKGALPDEASKSIFLWEGEKTSLEFFLKGSWTASLSSTPTLTFGTNGTSFSFGGSPFLFSQQPDLFLRMLLQKAFFFEASLSENLDDSSFSLGYLGQEGDFLKELRIGNAGLEFPEYRYLSFGPSSIDSPGASATFGWEDGRSPTAGGKGHAILRFDSVQPETRVYVGKELVTEYSVAATSFIRGKYFSLPDSGVTDVAVYLRGASGAYSDGVFSYSLLDSTQYWVSAARGYMEISDGVAERTLIAYDRLDSAPISAQASESAVIEGRQAVIAFDPGIRRESEILSRYDLSNIVPTTGRLEFDFTSIKSGSLDSEYGGSWDAEKKVLDVYGFGVSDTKSESARMPFANIAPEIYRDGVLPRSASPISILIRSYQAKERYEIDPKAIVGTIKITRNGIRETAFSYERNSGYVDLTNPVSETDRLEIEYLTPSSKTLTGNFAAGLGVDFTFTENLSAYVAMGGRWTLPWSPVSQPDGLVGGDIGLTSGISWKSEFWEASVDAGLSYARSDANDICRADGMEDFLITQPVTDGSWLRASLPDGFQDDARAPLVYRDYLESDAFGNSRLQNIDSATLPAASDSSVKQGPYRVADSVLKTAAVAEYAFQSGGAWCGMQTSLDTSILENLVQADSLIIPLRFFLDSGAMPDIVLQAGLLGPGPDDSASASAALPDSRHISDAVTVTPDPADTAWREYVIPLSAALKAALRSGAAVRIRISSASASAGRCLAGSLRLKGASYIREALPAEGELSLEQRYADGPEAVFQSAIEKLHADSSANAYMRLSVSGNASLSDCRVRKEFPVFPVESFQALTFFVRAPSIAPANAILLASLSDSSGELLSARIPLGGLNAGWGSAVVDYALSTGNVTYPDGQSLSFPVSVTRSESSAEVTLRWTLSGAETGMVDLDEVCLENARTELSGSINAAVSLKKTGTLWKWGALPLFSGLEAGLSGQLALSSAASYSGRSTVGFSLIPFVVQASADISGSVPASGNASAPSFTASHDLGLPFPFGSVNSLFSFDSAGDYSQKERASLALPSILDLGAEAQALQQESSLSQIWKANASVPLPREKISLLTVWTNSLRRESDLLGLSYPQAWIGSYPYLLPLDQENALARSARLEAAANATGQASANNADASALAATSYEYGLIRKETSELSFGISPLIRLGKDGIFRLKPEYSRKALLSRESGAASFGQDISQWADIAQLLPDIWRACPIAEFWDLKALGSLQALGIDPLSSTLDAKAGMSLERDGLGGLADLFIPIQASYSVTRETRRSGSVSTEALIHAASLDFHSLDLFGKMGRFPFFMFADNDEYLLKNTLSLTQPIFGREQAFQYSLSAYCLFGVCEGVSLDIKDDLRASNEDELFSNLGNATWTDTRKAGPGWQAERESIIQWLDGLKREKTIQASSAVLNAWMTEELDVVRKASAGIGTSLSDKGVFSLSLPLGYESGLSIKDRLSINAGAKMTVEWTQDAHDSLFNLGFDFSIKAKVEF